MEAKRYQVEVTNSELVGLIPRDTLIRSLRYYFKSEGIEFNKEMSFDEITKYAIKYLLFRDFDNLKIIEANI